MKRITKITITVLVAFALLLTVDLATAQERKASVKLGTDFVSSYIWRGSYNAGASVQPTLGFSAGAFSLTAWGSVDLASSDYKEFDLTAAYRLGAVTLSLADYYWTGAPDESTELLTSSGYSRHYFDFGSGSPHMVELGAAWCISERFPLTLAWNTMLFGHDKKMKHGAYTHSQNYSTYAEVSYPFAVKGVDMSAAVGITPWSSPMIYGTTGFAVCNVSLGAAKAIRFSGNFSMPVFVRAIWNPAKDDVNFVGGFSILL